MPMIAFDFPHSRKPRFIYTKSPTNDAVTTATTNVANHFYLDFDESVEFVSPFVASDIDVYINVEINVAWLDFTIH